MRSAPVWILIVSAALLSVPVLGAQDTRSDSSSPEAGAPGPYRGPGPDAVPRGWSSWSSQVHKQCGEFALVFRNPDLREDDQGVIHAQGQFFIQFQVVGTGSSKVEKMSFSFGVTHDALYDNPTLNCNSAIPNSPVGKGTGGVYLLYYRSDFDKSDGFFVPILTNNVPDGNYAAAIHAYDAAGNEVARAWAKATVDNCPGTGSERCGVDDSAAILQDKTMPWPMVLPGDGVQTNGVDGLTIEFGERINKETIQASINGESVALAEWTPPARDTDLIPNNDDQACPANVPPLCSRAVYGDGFQWAAEVKEGDVIRVSAADRNGNFAEKIIHYGLDTSGGTVDIQAPEITLTAINGASASIKPGEFHFFNIRLENVGSAEGHVSLSLNYSAEAGLEAYWEDMDGKRVNHVVVPKGGEVAARVHVITQPETAETSYTIKALTSYDKEGQIQSKGIDLFLKVDKSASGEHFGHHGAVNTTAPAPTNETAAAKTDEDGGGTPGPGFALVAFAAGLGFAVQIRRRRR